MRIWHFNKEFCNLRARFAQTPRGVEGKIYRGIRAAAGESPTVETGQASGTRNRPARAGSVTRIGIGGSDSRADVQRELSPDSKVGLTSEPQNIGKRDIPPGQTELRGLKPRGSSRDSAAQAERADFLQLHAGAHGLRLKVQPPSARGVLVNAAQNADQRKGTLVIALFEIDASAIHVNAVEPGS